MARPDFSVQAGKLNLEVEAGATHIEPFTWYVGSDPVDLVTPACTARLSVRAEKNVGSAVITLTEGSGITLGASGAITVEFTPVQTLDLAQLNLVNCYYDLEITFVSGADAGRVKRLIEGKLRVDWSASSV
jgi:hypothetical protein